MKSVIKETITEQVSGYPKLMRYSKNGHDFIVLFTENRTGTVVCDNSNTWGVGYYFKGWKEDYFIPFNGTIELSNN